MSEFDQPYRGGFVGAEHRFALTVYFEDTDAFGVVYYPNYLRFMERARSDMILATGVDHFQRFREDGSTYVVAEVHIRYRSSARVGDSLVVASTVEQVRAASVIIQQRVMRGTEVLTEGRVTAAFVTPDGRPLRQPKEWIERFRAIAARDDRRDFPA
jgi:acyl-CoA thioester hydrolase